MEVSGKAKGRSGRRRRVEGRSGVRKVVFAVAAHPDDIEFLMAGTLLRLVEAGWEAHYMTVATGSCGSLEHGPAKLRRVRRGECERAARELGARYHGPLADDLEIVYSVELLRRLAAVVRRVGPGIVLTHSPQDYMEDHVNTCRLAVTASFARGMPNFRTDPPHRTAPGDVAVYHAMPHGLTDALGVAVVPEYFVGTDAVHERKRRALAAHESQQSWLQVSQGMNSYLRSMEDMSLAVGKMSRVFRHAEGWRRHLHLGLSDRAVDALGDALGAGCRRNPRYRRAGLWEES